MIDEIFAMIIKEARHRPGKDLTRNITTVCIELAVRILAAVEGIRQQQTSENNDEDKIKHPGPERKTHT